MPVYEYKCQACGRVFEQHQTMSEASLKTCEHCGGILHRIVSGGAGFFLKNGGQDKSRLNDSGCSLERRGRTCCGDTVRCDTPGCGSRK